jgi:hypothetical protein
MLLLLMFLLLMLLLLMLLLLKLYVVVVRVIKDMLLESVSIANFLQTESTPVRHVICGRLCLHDAEVLDL